MVGEGTAQRAGLRAPGGGLLRHLLGHRVQLDTAGAEGLGGGGGSLGPRTPVSTGEEAPVEVSWGLESLGFRRLGKGKALSLGFGGLLR